MLVELTREVDLPADQRAAWAILRDVEQLASCVPGASDVTEVEPDRTYRGLVTDRVGPFKVKMAVDVTIEAMEEPSFLQARLSGSDRISQTTVDGSLQARIRPIAEGVTRLGLTARIEIRGPLTSLGAPVVRRRAVSIFDEFAQRLQAALSAPDRSQTAS